MDSITVDKNELIHKLELNRAAHAEAAAQARAGWQAAVLKALAESVDRFFTDSNLQSLNFPALFPEPQNHTKDYDTALEMLAWETGASVVLDQYGFRRLVQDEWDWTSRFVASSSQYTVT